MKATLQRLEDKIDSLLAAQPAAAAPRPSRTRQPAAAPAAAKTAKPRKTAAPKRGRSAP